ncbi:MAG: FlgD immunoglobulin-like domain containing protein, partial [Bacteroidota bacterium]
KSQGFVSLKIYNLLGQEVRTLVNTVQPGGVYSTSWDGKNDSGALLGSGIYFYRLLVDSFSDTRKMIVLR